MGITHDAMNPETEGLTTDVSVCLAIWWMSIAILGIPLDAVFPEIPVVRLKAQSLLMPHAPMPFVPMLLLPSRNLDQNQISGTIPAQLSALQNLEEL